MRTMIVRTMRNTVTLGPTCITRNWRRPARVHGTFPYGSPKSTAIYGQHYRAVAAHLEAEAQESLARAATHRQHAGLRP